jgi:anti-sigma B factor antagonist
MKLETIDINGVTIVAIPLERLDASNSVEFKKLMEPIMAQNSKVAVDLTAVRFMDSSGLGALLSCLRVVANQKGDLKLFGMKVSVRTLFELVRMHRIFEIVSTQDDAVQAFQSSPGSA